MKTLRRSLPSPSLPPPPSPSPSSRAASRARRSASIAALAAATAAGAGLAGCETTSSRDLRTSGIAAEIVVSANSSASSTVHVDMYPGGDDDPFNRVVLEGGDALFADCLGQSKQLAKAGLAYETSFPAAGAGTEFVVRLERASDEDRDAPGSIGVLPPPFTLTLGKAAYSRGETLVVSWAEGDAASAMSLLATGACIDDKLIYLSPDPGTYTFSPSTLNERDLGDDSCTVTIRASRYRSGTADPNLNDESSFTLEQVRSITFVSDP